MKNSVFINGKLPFLELRYVYQVNSCDKKHLHNELTLTAIQRGRITIEHKDESHFLIPGAISIVNPKEVHCAQLTQEESFGCYVLYLDERWCKNIQNELFLKRTDYVPFRKSLVEDKSLYRCFLDLCKDILLDEVSILEKEERLIEFISTLFPQYSDIHAIIEEKIKKQKEAYEIKRYIQENIMDEISLEDIAHEMNLSVVHILRIFKAAFGLPIHSYILNHKVHRAKELLSKNMSMVDVALESGFFDQSHLNRSFKRVFQLTPKEYQKNILS